MPQALDEILAELAQIEEANEKLRFLLALGDDLPEFPESEKIAENTIAGCASNAYVTAKYKDGKMYFEGDSDAQIPKAILAMFIFGLTGASPVEILQVKPEVLDRVGFKNMLSPSRINGAYQIFKRIQEEAGKCLS